MVLKLAWKDRLPKTNLNGGHLGDGFPLCSDLPVKYFLRRGSTFILTGKSSVEGYYSDVEWQSADRPRFIPNKDTSELYAALCANDTTTNKCTFPREVVLSRTINCDGDQECGADFLKVVKMVDGDRVMYYKHVAPTCVRFAW